MRLRDLEVEKLPSCKLMVQPVDRAVLQISQRIVSRRTRKFVFGEYRLLQPGAGLMGRIRSGFPVFSIPPENRLSAIAPRSHSLGVNHLSFHVESANEEGI